jgi:hypothetical protein
MYLGTTSLAINRSSASQSLTGITSIDGSAATVNNTGAVTANSEFYIPGISGNTTAAYGLNTKAGLHFNGSTGLVTNDYGFLSTPGTVTCSHTGNAIPLTAKVVEITTDGDGDQDNCTLAAGTAGQELELIVKVQGTTNDGLIITPSAAFVDAASSYVFAAASTGLSFKGKGLNLVYTSAGWSISAGNNPNTLTTPAANGSAAIGTATSFARADHVHASASGIGAVYKISGSNYTNATTTPSNITGLSWSIAANAQQVVRCALNQFNSNAGSAIRYNVTGPASPTRVQLKFRVPTTSATAEVITSAWAFSATAQSTSVTTSVYITNPLMTHIDMIIENGANAGTVQIQGAGSAAQSSTVYIGSYCEVY